MSILEFGRKGEKEAVRFLKKNKFKILDTNYYTRFGEIDIVAYDKKEKEFVFVEVKTRSNRAFGYPEDSVVGAKMERMERSAQIYIDKEKVKDNFRFDIIAIELVDENNFEIKHFRNVG